jgi:predicted dehydrogenase
MAYKMIQVGTGGRGRVWCSRILPPNIEDGLIEVVAAVDINPEALTNAREHLGLNESQCYTDLARAFEENEADFCTVVVPPAFHEDVVDLALARGMNILSEKPIADTLLASVRIAKKVKKHGVKMGVTMSHRFDQDKTTLREEIRSERCGDIDYLVCRFTCDCRKFGGWGSEFRHTMVDPLMIEGSVHHLDILADMAGSKCDTIYAQTWNPRWGVYGGDSQALVTMHMENGTRAFYEGAKTNAVGLNWWAQEYIRAECEGATLVLNSRKLERFPYDSSEMRAHGIEGEGEAVPLREQRKWTDAWLVEKFVKWLDGGEPMETNIEDNLQSVALIFAAIESSRTGMPVKVQEFLEATRDEVRDAM